MDFDGKYLCREEQLDGIAYVQHVTSPHLSSASESDPEQ
jgi:hypothetical protein